MTAPSDQETTFLLCESVRREEGNKLSLLGLYSGGDIWVPSDTAELIMPSLAFVFIFKDGEGVFNGQVSLHTPGGHEMLGESRAGVVRMLGQPSYALIVTLAPFTTKEFGQFKVTLTLDTTSYVRIFGIHHGEPPPT